MALMALGALVLGCSSTDKPGFSARGYADAAAGALPPEAGAPDGGGDATASDASDAGADAQSEGGVPACTINIPKDQKTLTDAIAVAADGDVICVADGTYDDTVTVSSKNRSLTLRASGKNAIWNGELLVDGAPGTGHTLVVEGFQFGCAPSNVSLSGSTGRVVVRNNHFDNGCGYALDLENSGAGSVTVVFERNELTDTSLSASLAAPAAGAGALVVLKNNLVTGGAGFGLLGDGAWARYVVLGNTFDVDPGYTLVQLDLGVDEGAGSSVRNNILAGGDTAISCLSCKKLAVSRNMLFSGDATYGDIQLGEGNLEADPLFRAADDFRLQLWSPALYAGRRTAGAPADEDLASDIEGRPRPAVDIDMGAYQHE
jgi:hypothetical protein